ncbi:MAG: response regulator [Spirochaetales bacterium]|nr:response regulator [Spirochaetales bacterium]
MLKVLLVDDEPFLLQGLKVLIDWEFEGYEIVYTASNGIQALEYLQKNSVDLIIADIKMPGISGIDLLEKIHKDNISHAYFIILSGHADFNYAQRAIRYNCTDYILKPIERNDLIKVLKKVTSINDSFEKNIEENRKMERAFLARNIISLISGKYDTGNVEYVKDHLKLSSSLRYINFELDYTSLDKLTDEEKRADQRKLFNACVEFIKDYQNHFIFDVSRLDNVFDVGFIYCEFMDKNRYETESLFFDSFLSYLKKETQLPVLIFIGEKVDEICQISSSYRSVNILRSFQGFRKKRSIYYYEKEAHISNEGNLLCKKTLDALIKSIEHNNHDEILKNVENFYNKMKKIDVVGEVVTLNINYLLFQLINLASLQDDSVNQEEIFRLISESSFEDGITHGSKAHLTVFACKYGDYLQQLRCNVSRGIFGRVEKEIEDNYSKNLTLKDLSEKLYVNSAYLGQIFRKKYGHSFKDYLNNYRIDQAAMLLLRTDLKIYQIAESVGYHDQDYFIRRFISSKGCTPTKYRKKVCNIDEKNYILT